MLETLSKFNACLQWPIIPSESAISNTEKSDANGRAKIFKHPNEGTKWRHTEKGASWRSKS